MSTNHHTEMHRAPTFHGKRFPNTTAASLDVFYITFFSMDNMYYAIRGGVREVSDESHSKYRHLLVAELFVMNEQAQGL